MEELHSLLVNLLKLVVNRSLRRRILIKLSPLFGLLSPVSAFVCQLLVSGKLALALLLLLDLRAYWLIQLV